MTREDAIELIRPAAPEWRGGRWADLGAGSGTFTAALSVLLGPGGRVIAVDNDSSALRNLRQLADNSPGAPIIVVQGDVLQLDGIDALKSDSLDGVVFANVLHFVAAPQDVLARVRKYLHNSGRIVVIEYDRRSANRWVPHPLPPARLADAAQTAGCALPVEVGRRVSRYQGEMYCAVVRYA